MRYAAQVLLAAVMVGSAEASVIVAPATGAREAAMGGNTVAAPRDGPSILGQNPAGIVDGRGTEAEGDMFLAFPSARYTNGAIGYDAKSAERPIAPTLWISTDRLGSWRVGGGLYGAVGAAFNFPSANRFFSELSVIHLGLVAGREIAPGLRVALQAAPTYGRIRIKTPSPLGPVSFDVDGFGIVGVAGLLYDLGERATLGISYRSPGVVFMDGGARVGGAPDRVTIDFRTPQNVRFGFAYRATDRLTITAQARWTDYPQFENGKFEFDRNAVLNHQFISDARATFRYGVGLEFAVRDWVWLRAGMSREEWMIEPSAVSPLLFDNTDFEFGVGAGVEFDPWTSTSRWETRFRRIALRQPRRTPSSRDGTRLKAALPASV